MKRLLTILSVAVSMHITAQSMQISDATASTHIPVSPNDTAFVTTDPFDTRTLTYDIKNVSSSTKTFVVQRYDVMLNSSASAFFCFAGSCYPETVFSSTTALNAGQSTWDLGHDADSYQMLQIELQEGGTTVGESFVKYTIYDAANRNDSVQISISYNKAEPVGIAEVSKTVSSFEIFPNPASDLASFQLSATKAADAKLSLYNTLGSLMLIKPISISEGKNKMELNLGNLPAGIYIAELKTGSSSATKRLIIK